MISMRLSTGCVLFTLCVMVAACGGEKKNTTRDTTETNTDVTTTADGLEEDGTTSEDAETSAGVGFITEALPCEPSPGTGVGVGTELVKVTLSGENVVCNDGSPAVMYVRRAENDENIDNWVFHLQGGGSCGGVDCAQRWCGRNEKMTSSATPPSMAGKGIMRRGSENALGDANQVFLYYCSSDNWAGTQSDVEIPGEGEIPSFRVHFRGDDIVTAALDTLEAGATSDDGSQTLPPLAGGGWALWTGTSGGCSGVVNTADRAATRLKGLGVDPWIVCDANFSPDAASLPEGDALDAYIAQRQFRYDITQTYAQTRLDESCVAAHPGDDGYVCDWPGYVLGNHITEAPVFVRMSFADRSISDAYLAAGFTLAEFAAGVRDTMVRAAASAGHETPPQPISVYGPGCEQHVGLTNDEWFFQTTITVESEGVDATLHDAIVAWMGGRDVVAMDTIPPTLSVCGTTTDETD